jgi:hypothetical protein
MKKIILVINVILFLNACETNTVPDRGKFGRNDSLSSSTNDSVTNSLRPLSSFINEFNPSNKKIQDTLLSYPEIRNILKTKSDKFDVNLFVFGGQEIKDSLGNVTRMKLSKSNYIISLWSISRNSNTVIRHGNFHFNLNSMNFYVTDTSGKMSMETWCRKQYN